MQNFHDHKLWQESFVALMDIYEVSDTVGGSEREKEVMSALILASQNVSAKIADGLSRRDARIGRSLVWDAVGLIAITRTQLAVSWGRGLINDETFKKIDDKYAGLTEQLQFFK